MIRRTLKVASVLAGVVLATTAFVAPGQASQFESGDEDATSGVVPYTGPLPSDISRSVQKDVPGEMTTAMSRGIWGLEIHGYGEAVNTYEWESESETLLIYSSEGAEFWNPLLVEFLPGERVKIVPASHSRADVDAVLESIAARGGRLTDTARIVTAIPERDGSAITLGIESEENVRSFNTEELAQSLRTSIPLLVEEAPEVTQALRNHSYTDSIWYGGNVMTTLGSDPGTVSRCTTAFAITNITTSARGMLSAEHCGRDKPQVSWFYGNGTTPPTARSIGHFQGFVSSGSYNSDTGLWTSGNLPKLYPIIFTGDYQNTTTAAFVDWGNFPAVGTNVCYSGAFSGNVCDNEVLYQAILICYSVTQCYAPITWTSQVNSIESVGNGDSGGPVYQMVGGQLNASGVISGIVGGSSTCTGEPGTSGGRQCSPVALYAPIVAAVGSGGDWQLLVAP